MLYIGGLLYVFRVVSYLQVVDRWSSPHTVRLAFTRSRKFLIWSYFD